MAICVALYTCLRQKGVMWSHITSCRTNMGESPSIYLFFLVYTYIYSYLSLRHKITYYFPPYITLTFNDMPV